MSGRLRVVFNGLPIGSEGVDGDVLHIRCHALRSDTLSMGVGRIVDRHGLLIGSASVMAKALDVGW